jgi:hypothetical protein
MYSKAEVAQLRQAFWTTFGQYMAPVPSAEGLPTNWINYKTGVRHLHFRLQADARRATISIELTHPDPAVRAAQFAQFEVLRTLLHDTTGQPWRWEAEAQTEHGQSLSRIFQELTPVNLFSRDDWPALISFFKPRLMALDAFWTDAQYSFHQLE